MASEEMNSLCHRDDSERSNPTASPQAPVEAEALLKFVVATLGQVFAGNRITSGACLVAGGKEVKPRYALQSR